MHVTRSTPAPTLDAPPHEHTHIRDAGITDGPPPVLVALALAVQARCHECVAHHARQATAAGATRRELLEALGTALLLSRDRADSWAPLADTALEPHMQARSGCCNPRRR